MTDFSKIQTIDELEYQTQRMERKAEIQYENIHAHVNFVVGQYTMIANAIDATVAPLRKAWNEYRTAFRVGARIVKAFMPRKKK